ncbi:hypothetical protein BD410DRAFT_785531 [Rickenella mellea]|uniref:Vacuolar import and degradation protein n=1 Tax=Rickenella mellea TaxID=50990 RepID=A0A4Y7QAV9_9AGAM|nr:hypothetical protein BD410DRAFT_785531 [Rickenella mellea]
MPSEQFASPVLDPVSLDQPQVKLCTDCHHPLTADATTVPPFFYADSSDTAMVCSVCREKLYASRDTFTPDGPIIGVLATSLNIDVAPRHALHTNNNVESRGLHIDTQTVNDSVVDLNVDITTQHKPINSSPTFAAHRFRQPPPSAGSPPRRQYSWQKREFSPVSSFGRPSKSPVDSYPSPISSNRYPPLGGSPPDPFVDITRLRVKSQGYGCLYPGAIFQGTQKSGRNSYDVNVTIVDVDFSSSFLCGYLRIRGLTDDWPELTTYFDAEIIGSRHGFLTQGWGASEQEDMVHWARFPAFRQVQNELQKPRYTMKDRDRGAVFMRWKERFLVPDHRVQDINGASFAGFYYVCVDFNPQPVSTSSLHSPHEMPSCPEGNLAPPAIPHFTPPKPEAPISNRRGSSAGRLRRPSHANLHPIEEPVASMCGFYFHQNSEPYQQLSLSHVKDNVVSSFEFR